MFSVCFSVIKKIKVIKYLLYIKNFDKCEGYERDMLL